MELRDGTGILSKFVQNRIPFGVAERLNQRMVQLRRIALALACLIAFAFLASPPTVFAQTGYTGSDSQRMGQWLQFNQLTLYRLEMPEYASPYSAALTSGRHGWRIVVFLRDGGETNVDWDSKFLKRPFEVASTDNFVPVPQVGNHFGVTFSGCRTHDCANVYGALLYLPWNHQYFEKDVAGKSVACSQALLDPKNAAVLQALDAALRRQKAGAPEYVPPTCPGAASKKP